MVYNKLCVKLLSNLLGISGLQSIVFKIAKEILTTKQLTNNSNGTASTCKVKPKEIELCYAVDSLFL